MSNNIVLNNLTEAQMAALQQFINGGYQLPETSEVVIDFDGNVEACDLTLELLELCIDEDGTREGIGILSCYRNGGNRLVPAAVAQREREEAKAFREIQSKVLATMQATGATAPVSIAPQPQASANGSGEHKEKRPLLRETIKRGVNRLVTPPN